MRKYLKICLKFGFLMLVLILLSNIWIVYRTKSLMFYNSENLPSNDYGLVLGTSKKQTDGQANLFFKYRMEAAAKLYEEGKIKKLILSGNNDSPYYNEPEDMRESLSDLGIPDEAMILDYAGFRTYDSMLRAKKVFGQKRVTIISQAFHNHRALYICQHRDIIAVAYAAQDVPNQYSLKTLIREYLSRPKTILDVYVLDPIVSLQNEEKTLRQISKPKQ